MIYQIKVQGQIDPNWSEWFGGMDVSYETGPDGNQVTCFTGCLPDQAALRGVMDHLWDLNLVILSVHRMDPSVKPAGDDRRSMI